MIGAEHARRIAFDRRDVTHTGGHGLWLRTDVRDSRVTDGLFEDLGGGGVYIGPADREGDMAVQVSASNRVENCVIAHGGRHYFSSIGLFVGHGSDNTLEHNHISDLFYSGFSVGWVWGYGDSVAKRNRIADNRVQHLGHGLLCDMGGIYTLGKSEGTVVTGNIFQDIHCYEYGGWGCTRTRAARVSCSRTTWSSTPVPAGSTSITAARTSCATTCSPTRGAGSCRPAARRIISPSPSRTTWCLRRGGRGAERPVEGGETSPGAPLFSEGGGGDCPFFRDVAGGVACGRT
ncbi:MAG: right-handed parallel beta-helix repeat-containing protein [Kiritimatiellia bacterium]